MKKCYKTMLEGMRKNDGKRKKSRKEKWYLYILRCNDLSLYTGITKNLEKRFETHSLGKGARYTRTRRPLEMVYHEKGKTRTDALVRECAIKALSRQKKLELIESYVLKCAKKNEAK